MMRYVACVLTLALLGLAGLFTTAAHGQDSPALAAGLTLEALPAEALDQIEKELGHRVGVLVAKVRPDSPAALAGLKEQDLLLVVAAAGVDSPQAVERALAGKTGAVAIMGARKVGEEFQPLELTMTLPAAGAAPAPGPAQPTPAPQPAQGDIQAKLNALKAAHDAGVLTDEEYAKKKAELEAQLKAQQPALDAETKKKLDALEGARQAGVISEEEYAKKKAELLKGAPTPAGAPASPGLGKKGSVYRHAIGFSFWYPAGWTVKDQNDFLQLTPPNPSTNAQGPTELYFVIGEAVEGGVQSADDPQVGQYLDEQVRQFSAALQRVGKLETIPTSHGKGVMYDWEAKAQAGVVRARAYVNIIRLNGVALIALGLKESLDARDSELRQMFASFGMDEGTRDEKLVGSWSLVNTQAITNTSPYETAYSRARMVSDTQSTLEIRADGTWRRVDVTQMIAMGAGVSLESKDEKEFHGTWNAGDGKVYLMEANDTWTVCSYQVGAGAGGRQLILTYSNSRETWKGN